jgi:hypothetical protein
VLAGLDGKRDVAQNRRAARRIGECELSRLLK